MRVLRQLPVPQDQNLAKFPDGTIQNETDTQDGTPVVRELYGDVLTNIYKLLSLADITPTGNEDAEDTQYQLVQALKLFSNELNDVEQVLTLTGSVWSVPFKLSIVPDKYVFVGLASEPYNPAINYTFKGIEDNPVISMTSITGFDTGDELLVIVDQSGVKVISLTKIIEAEKTVTTSFGFPLPFNDTQLMYYLTNGRLINDTPFEKDLQTQIRASSADALALIQDCFILKEHVLCFTFLPTTTTYKFYQFPLSNLDTVSNVPVTGITIPVGSDNKPYCYTDGEFIYISNRAGTLADGVDDNEFSKFSYTPATPIITRISNFEISNNFEKTSNAVIKDDTYLYTFIDSVLKRYDMGAGTVLQIGNFETINGQIFGFQDN